MSLSSCPFIRHPVVVSFFFYFFVLHLPFFMSLFIRGELFKNIECCVLYCPYSRLAKCIQKLSEGNFRFVSDNSVMFTFLCSVPPFPNLWNICYPLVCSVENFARLMSRVCSEAQRDTITVVLKKLLSKKKASGMATSVIVAVI